MPPPEGLRARLAVLAAAVLWSTGGAGIKACTLGPFAVAGGRSLVAAIFVFAALPSSRVRPDRRILAVGAAYAATVVLFVLATKATTAANAIFIQDTAPLWVLLLGPRLLGERPTRAELLAVPVFLGGLALFFLDQLGPGQLWGNLVALASGLTFALSILGLRRIPERAAVLGWGNTMAAAVALPFAASSALPSAPDALIVVYLGIFQLGLSYALFSRGLAGTPAVEASLLVLLEPVLNPVWTYAFTRERPGPWAIAGGAVVLAATVWRIVAARPRATARR
jgi:drug/metabolite transporter, DME family